MIGTQFDDHITGNEANNVIDGARGADIIDGGLGSDTVSYAMSIFSFADDAVQIDLNNTVQHGGEAEGDQLTSIENIIGTAKDDTIRGDSNDNRLDGNVGNDTIFGRGGDDTIVGNRGADTLDGGSGHDTFVYNSFLDSGTGFINLGNFGRTTMDFGHDTIQNFETGVDKIDLSAISSHLHFATSSTDHSEGAIRITDTKVVVDGDGVIASEFSINVVGVHAADLIF